MARTAAATATKRSADPESFYAKLQVSPRAEAEVINAAYRALSKTRHPDMGGNHVDFEELTQAWQTLMDPAARASYDAGTRSSAVGARIGNYEVLELIAEGGFGKTYKAKQVITGESACIKHCENVSASHDAVLIGEAKSIWDLRHYALPAMRDMHRLEDGSMALIMSFIEGPTLEKVVEKTGKIDPETVAWMADRILNALLYLHHHGVIHGDIKPQNVIVQPETHGVVLVDFGLSMVKPTAASRAAGYTDDFAPPEQIDGKPLLPASDYYSLGMLMVYALTGGSEDAIKNLKVPTSAPDPMCRFIKSLIAKDVLARPQGELWDEFRAVRKKAFGRERSGMKPITGL